MLKFCLKLNYYIIIINYNKYLEKIKSIVFDASNIFENQYLLNQFLK